MSKLSHSNPALDDCLGHSSKCEKEAETQRVMRQASRIMQGFVHTPITEEELEERREQFLRENYEEREETDKEHHGFYY